MEAIRVPDALADRLGEPASAALVELLDANNRACADDVMMQGAERFERRLIEETSKLRVEMAELRADLRQDMAGLRSDLRQEIARLGSDLRTEMATNRVELLKWAFLFWVGQFVGVVGFVGLMLRLPPPR